MPTPDEQTTEVASAQPGIDDFDFDFAETVAPPRRRKLPLLTSTLALCAAVGGGVVLGIAIQKHWGGLGSSGAGSLAAALASSGGSSGNTAAKGSSSGTLAPGTATFGPGGTSVSATAGQVKAIDGTSLYITDTDGNVVKVTTDPGVTVRVTKSGNLKSIAPGDFVVVQGTKTRTGYKASSINDSGAGGGLAGGFGGLGNRSAGSGGGNQSGGGGTAQRLPGLP